MKKAVGLLSLFAAVIIIGCGCSSTTGLSNNAPVIESITPASSTANTGSFVAVTVNAMDADGDQLQCKLGDQDAVPLTDASSILYYRAPDEVGAVTVALVVSDGKEDAISSFSLNVVESAPAATPEFPATGDINLGSALWDLNGFISTYDAYTGTDGFYSQTGNNVSNNMTLRTAIPIRSGDALSFYTKYRTENNYDYLWVEASADGSYWQTIQYYCGNQSSWVQKTLSLDYFAGQSIYIRFRYSTDGSIYYSGAYVDDVKIER